MPGIELSATPPVSIGNTVIDVQSRIVVIQGDRVEFTSKEFDLLCFFAKYPNWALTRGQILDSVWDDSPAATYHAVENTIYRIRRKLGMNAGIEIVTIIGYGYKLIILNE